MENELLKFKSGSDIRGTAALGVEGQPIELTDERVDKMISEGLVGEVEGLYSKGLLPTESTAAQAIGYKEIVEYLKREITLCEAVEKVKLSTRRYAKRQLTWFRHSDAVRIYADGEDGKMRSYDELCREVILAAKGLVSEWSKT